MRCLQTRANMTAVWSDETLTDVTGQFSHALTGTTIVFGTIVLFAPKWLAVTLPLFIVYASVKEFWYDNTYETAEQRGSNWEDWGFYMVGMVTALALWGCRVYYDRRMNHYKPLW